MTTQFTVFAISDATGELAHKLSVAAVRQFPQQNPKIVRVSEINNKNEILPFVLKAKECRGIIVFTFVSSEMRREMLKLSKEHEIVAIDVMGRTLDVLANYLHTLPSSEPGLQYKLTQNYFNRTEAVEFAVKHDDGLGLDSIHESDIILLGPSRTLKTPLSIYLAYNGYRCANFPILKDVALPEMVSQCDRNKLIGLTMKAERLSMMRSERLRKLGRSASEGYASLSHICEEIEYASRIYRDLKIQTVNITGKAIEESASEILQVLHL